MNLSPLSYAALMACGYIIVLRLIDLNEKEPLWALGLLFALGASAAALLSVMVSSVQLELSVSAAAFATATAIACAAGAGFAILGAVARLRGWREIGDAMDGLVYGAATGLGFATGRAFLRHLAVGDLPGDLGTLFTPPLWAAALSGLAYGVFGGIIGAGFALALDRQSPMPRLAAIAAGYFGAVVACAAYLVLARGGALGGPSSVVRLWTALLLPPAAVVVVAILSLRQERRAISTHLADELSSGGVTADEAASARSLAARISRSWRTLAFGKLESWGALKLQQNRLVQLALAKERLVRASSADRKAAAAAEIERLRSILAHIRLLVGESR